MKRESDLKLISKREGKLKRETPIGDAPHDKR
jgi:hypothetical protein